MRARASRLLDAAFLRFALVGSINTAIDLVLFLVLHGLGVPLLVGNFVSTSCGLGFSFVANRSFTFRQDGGPIGRQLITFLAGTGVGLWLVQPAVIAAVGGLLAGTVLTSELQLFISKAIAIVIGMVWNWLLYSRWVFRPAAASTLKSAEVVVPAEHVTL